MFPGMLVLRGMFYTVWMLYPFLFHANSGILLYISEEVLILIQVVTLPYVDCTFGSGKKKMSSWTWPSI